MTKPRILGALLIAASAGACAGLQTAIPDTRLSSGVEVQRAIEQHYRAYATEDYGRCKRPYFSTIADPQVIDESEEQLVLDIGYFYRDRLRDEEDTGEEIRPGETNSIKVCRGYERRQFTLAKDEGRLRVTDMTGEGRERPLGAATGRGASSQITLTLGG